MSGWTILTVRAQYNENYERSRYDDLGVSHSLEDLAATMEDDDRIRRWTLASPHIYAYLACSRYDWEFAENLLEEYEPMMRDAVVLGANDTTDTGTARYYPKPNQCTDEYKETQSEDGTHVGEIALRVMTARHGIIARDPFHGWLGEFDDRYANDGESQL